MAVKLNYSGTITDSIGAEHGISPADFEKFLQKNRDVLDDVRKDRETGLSDFLDLPHDTETVRRVIDLAEENRGRWKNVVVIGIGGSALGTTALVTALAHPFHNLAETPRVFVMDNIDPAVTEALFDVINVKETLFLVITKSGSTAETVGMFALALGRLKGAMGDGYASNVIALTDPDKGPLRALARAEGFRTMPVPDGVGGRFSVLTPVGLLPAALAGIDVKALCAGAAEMDEKTRDAGPMENIAFVYAALMYLLDSEKGKSINVFMPYSSRLRDVADWFRQLWAESLGKRLSTGGAVVNTGQTPVKALGATDQHSQVQLYVEGPFDKVITFVRVKDYGATGEIPAVLDDEALSYLCGRTLAELIKAEALGTEAALRKAGRPTAAFELDSVGPEDVGGLMFCLELATAYAGRLYGINPFDQPGVEAGKIAAYALMGRPGYEKKTEEPDITGTEGGKYIVG